MSTDNEAVALEHMAVAEEGKVRWMSGRRVKECELYAMPDFGRAPKLYPRSSLDQRDARIRELEAANAEHKRLWLEACAAYDQKNPSGCVCSIDQETDQVQTPCALHAEWLESQLRDQAAARQPHGWLPIESAPKDRVILLELPVTGNLREEDRRVYEGRWHGIEKTWTSVNGFLLLTGATHWQPLPAPPTNGITGDSHE